MDGNKIYDKATLAFTKLSTQPGDIIVIKFPGDILPAQMEKFADGIKDHIPEDVVILCTRGGVDIERIPESEMNKLGWYKFSSNTPKH